MLKRLKSLFENMAALGPIMGYCRCFAYLILSKGKPNAVAKGKYRGIPFSFRKRDVSAVKEVLVKEEYGFLKDILQSKQNPIVFDIGAHIGLFAIWVFSVNPSAQIISVEASPGTFDILQKNRNGVDEGHFSWNVFHKAAWGNAGEISFMDESESSMSHRVGGAGNVHVSTITLNDLMAHAGHQNLIDVVKIDIEGAEESFLCANPFDFAKFQTIAMEIHPSLCDTKKVQDSLQVTHKLSNVKEDSLQLKPLLLGTRHH